MGVKRIDNMLTELKSDFSQLNKIVYLAQIKQLETQVGQILANLNAGPKDRLSKNDTHAISVVTKGGQTPCKDVFYIHKGPNEKESDE